MENVIATRATIWLLFGPVQMLCVLSLRQPAPAWTTFRVGLYCGVFLVLLVTVVITGKAYVSKHFIITFSHRLEFVTSFHTHEKTNPSCKFCLFLV